MGGLFLGGWGTGFTAYAAIQTVAVLKLRGRARIACLIPALLMAIVVVVTAIAYLQGSNLWPILLIFASPVAALLVFFIRLGSWFLRKRSEAVA